jgi:hypothetical protein
MITLYHSDAACSFRPRWMLEELSLAYALKIFAVAAAGIRRQVTSISPASQNG